MPNFVLSDKSIVYDPFFHQCSYGMPLVTKCSLMLLLYPKCYGFKREFYILRRFLSCIPWYCLLYRECYWFYMKFFTLNQFFSLPIFLSEPAFIKASLVTGNFTWKAAGQSCLGLEHSPSLTVCLNHIAILWTILEGRPYLSWCPSPYIILALCSLPTRTLITINVASYLSYPLDYWILWQMVLFIAFIC